MSMPPGPPPGPPAGAGPPVRRRRRPPAWWFALPLVLLVAGVAMAASGFVGALGPLTEEYGVVAADAVTRDVAVAEPGTVLLYRSEGAAAPTCEAAVDGEPVEVEGPGGSFTFSGSSGSWTGFASVDAPGRTLSLTCSGGASAESQVRVGPRPALGGSLAVAFGGLGLVGLGLVVLVLLVVLTVTGAPRRRS